MPDDLLDVAHWCKSLREHKDKPELELGRMILAAFPEKAGELVQICQSEPDREITHADRILLASAFNVILKREDLYAWVDLSQFDLPGEARRLASKKGEDLPAYEIERRNRLLLEAAFPELIRKLYGLGWRPVMMIYGTAGLFIALLFWALVRDRPEDHPRCDAAERALIAEGQPLEASTERPRVEALPIKHILRHRSLWLGSITQFGTNVGWVFLLTWLPRYLDEVHHVPVVERGLMTSLPTLLGMAGMVAGGWLTDYLTRRMGLRWGRCLPMALTRFLAMAAFLVCIQLRSPWAATVAFCVVAIATDLGTPAMWAFAQDIGGRNVGSVLGWGNMWGNLGATLSPLLLNFVVEGTNWTVGFLVCAGAFLVAGVAALGIDARQPIVPT